MRKVGITGDIGSGKDSLANWLIEKHGGVKVGMADSGKRLCIAVFRVSINSMFGPSSERSVLLDRGKGDFYEWLADCAGRLDAADPVIDGCTRGRLLQHFYAVCRKHFEKPYNEGTLNGRLMLQIMLTEWGRELNPDVWVNRMFRDTIPRIEHGYDYTQSGGLFHDRIDRDPESVIVIPDVRFSNEPPFIRKHGGVVYFVDAEARIGKHDITHASEVSRDKRIAMSDFILDNNGPMDWRKALAEQVSSREYISKCSTLPPANGSET